ncbi:MAG: hypothetical protein QW282_06060 [Nitrososphaerales archaeon]
MLQAKSEKHSNTSTPYHRGDEAGSRRVGQLLRRHRKPKGRREDWLRKQ